MKQQILNQVALTRTKKESESNQQFSLMVEILTFC